jgi:hypothetical protein
MSSKNTPRVDTRHLSIMSYSPNTNRESALETRVKKLENMIAMRILKFLKFNFI